MKTHSSRRAGWRHGAPARQGGVSIVLVTLALFMLLAFTALSVDGGNLFVARNELHNAADAGSLAGARFLYTEEGSSVNPGANQIATDAAQANNSQSDSAEVISALRGHWSFANRTFTPNDSLTPVNLSEKSTAELDQYDPFEPFINAVEVVTARQQTQVEAFFGRVLGFEGYDVMARSVAYIGFTGTLRPEDVDQPIAICKQALQDPDGNFSCHMGRFIPDGDQTGGWTNFEHDQNGATNADELRNLVEGDGNENEMYYGDDIATNNGQVQTAFQAFYDRWVDETNRETTWSLTLPVIDCEDGVAPSNRLVGTVTVHIVWAVSNAQENKIDEFAPERMGLESDMEGVEWPGNWENASTDGQVRWDDFVDHFSLQSQDGAPADWRKMSIYFLPSCDYHEPKGQTGGENFGILARIPVLVD
ncbi:TadG family pilus assembly protein [Halomonas sp. LR5S13]|uniref:pilus assembly protein TadG-related protein n=1 Tax=Halomonas rhizosphaerae TaxID=3043296 RepID=UPI0024A81F81|nr:pilus assembly protein TadG-related protein [Halomonas rhizosphaerae]MDI5921125.1 TadG family pilus assembly protein [Halomonas rhizosphaerae]